MKSSQMQHSEIPKTFLSESQVPAKTGTSLTHSGTQLKKTAILVKGTNSLFTSKNQTITLVNCGFT